MRASDWLNTESGTFPVRTPSFSEQPAAGQPATPEFWKLFGMWPLRMLPDAQVGSQSPDATAHVLPVGSVAAPPPAKKPFAVGISWSSPWKMPEVLCVAG